MIARFTLLFFIVAACFGGGSPVAGKKICIDAGHGGTALTDSYRVGVAGEREEWINLRVALALKKMLEAKGAEVIMTRTADEKVELAKRGEMAIASKADLFVSIHHNATADRAVNFPIVYFHGAASENDASVQAGKLLAQALRLKMFGGAGHISVVSDYTILPEKGAAVLRHSYGIPGLLAEASFLSNEDEEKRLKGEAYNVAEAAAFYSAIEAFFSSSHPAVKPKKIPDELPVFAVLQEADRMKPEALNWLNDFETGKKLFLNGDNAAAYELFTRSARSFPDSWVARECHEYRSKILLKMGKVKEGNEEAVRAKEFYVLE